MREKQMLDTYPKLVLEISIYDPDMSTLNNVHACFLVCTNLGNESLYKKKVTQFLTSKFHNKNISNNSLYSREHNL